MLGDCLLFDLYNDDLDIFNGENSQKDDLLTLIGFVSYDEFQSDYYINYDKTANYPTNQSKISDLTFKTQSSVKKR